MATLGIVPAFEEVEDGHARFGLGAEAPSLEQLAFEGGGNALAKGSVVGVTDRAHRRSDAGLSAAFAEGVRRVLGGFNWSSQHLDDEVSRCRNGNGESRIERVGPRCGRLVDRRSRGVKSSKGFGRRSLRGYRARMLS